MSDDDTPKSPHTPWHKAMPTPNPLGRKKGTPNRFSQKLISDFAADWREHGAAAIAELRESNVAAYVKTACSLVPRELLLQISRPMAEMSDDELQQAALREHEQATMLIEHVRTLGGEALLEQARREVLGEDEEDDD